MNRLTQLLTLLTHLGLTFWWVGEGFTTLTLIATNLISLIGNYTQFRLASKRSTSEVDERTIASYQRSHEANKLEIDDLERRVTGLKSELESVTAEYKTLVGVDIRIILDFAREGLAQENVALRRQCQGYQRRFGVLYTSSDRGGDPDISEDATK